MTETDGVGRPREHTLRYAFWSNFWPGLVSTVIGILVGVPIALYLTHYGVSIQEKAHQADERVRMHRGLESLAVAVRENAKILQHLSESVRENRVPFDVALDVTAWDVSKQEIIPFLHDAEMQRRIAHHFTRTESARRLFLLLLDQYVGVASALTGSVQFRKDLRSHLQREAENLSREADRLADDIAKVLGR